jgi:serine/threonine protein kinase
MTDARKASELVSKSLREELSPEESAELSQYMVCEETQKFAAASKLIQQSVVVGAKSIVDGDDSELPALSVDAKQRMRDSLNAASQEKLRLSQAGLLRSATVTGSRTTPQETKSGRAVTSRFQVIRPLAEGGLGNVWLVRDEKMNRTVAMKELNRQGLESPKAWERFQREAEITGMLEHPNIIPIYQFGEDRQSAEPFYTMRFVGKKTLSDAILEYHDLVAAGEEGPLGLHRLLSVFSDVCQAIAYAHSRGVVHRDLKPENIALDSFGQVIVLDWGLAKVLEEGELFHKLSSGAGLSESSMTKTMQGDIVGTPLYMSPEQAAGDLDGINERTDIYGLGAILFAILTGNAPHAQSLGDSADLSQAVRSISQKETPRVRDENPAVPSELDKICAKAMARKQHMRFTSVSAFAEAIEKWMAGQSDMNARYEAMRAEGRDLCGQLNAFVGALERNVRFMSRLPPINQLMHAKTDEETATWRERLATIFEGLLDANADYGSVFYRSVTDGTSRELVRVERHSRESNRIRIVPRSRLMESPTNPMVNFIMQQKPGDVVTTLIQMADDENNTDCVRDCMLAGVPVFDDATEDAFGLVLIECDANSILRHQLSGQIVCSEIVIVSGSRVIMRKIGDRFDEDSIGMNVSSLAPFHDATAWLESHTEYIDTTDAQVYGRRIQLNASQSNLLILLRT